ncbi:hypothetical protein LZZ85_19920 [Terrimonas sp. NA20]|uniref:DUF3098 domain-containing protein n=1 Tax=Terrimonas ginsenosidimutans TaxID=2908004 RepID=A0ABS9KWE1_9BACT|nr:hypothetical protein [Terrimonas ginsenosidimutans]MCG2616577.1 hypothetical protein [Terrimonas ginsenosidimutans]
MSNLNAFYKIGAVGLILTIALHVCFANVAENSIVHTGFALLYPSWIAFLGLGFLSKRKVEVEE